MRRPTRRRSPAVPPIGRCGSDARAVVRNASLAGAVPLEYLEQLAILDLRDNPSLGGDPTLPAAARPDPERWSPSESVSQNPFFLQTS